MSETYSDKMIRQQPVVRVESDNPEHLRLYLELRRRALIQELRQIDRLLGKEQTIPERQR